MYEWEGGRHPFTGTTVEEIRLKHLFEAPAPLGSFFKKTTFGVERLICECLEKDPTKRLPDYASLDLALEKAAKKRNIRYRKFLPSVRYEMPMVGARSYGDYLDSAKGTRDTAGIYRIVKQSEIEKFMREADALLAVGDYKKAEENRRQSVHTRDSDGLPRPPLQSSRRHQICPLSGRTWPGR